MKSELGLHIKHEGWYNWNDPEKEQNVFYAEFENTGPGFDPENRVQWSDQLTSEMAEKYTLENIFGGWDPLERLTGVQE